MKNRFPLNTLVFLNFERFAFVRDKRWVEQGCRRCKIWGRRKRKKHPPRPLVLKSGHSGYLWLHIWISTSPHGGQPSHVSQSLRSHIPSFNLSMRWGSDMLPDRIFVRRLVLFRLIRASVVCTSLSAFVFYERFESKLLMTLLTEGYPATSFLH